MITASDLPVELHAEILQNLHHYQDRHTLLSTALVCKDWCTPSQSVLFSAMCDHSFRIPDRQVRAMATHIKFLQTITEYPNRLGPLVRSYAQDTLSCNPAATGPLSASPNLTSSVQLWTLTEKALPAMVNLKYLYFSPMLETWPAADGYVSSSKLLNSFTFQLMGLTWATSFDPQNGLPEFLATQHNLIHLESGRDLNWLDDGVCRNLVSVSCGFYSFGHVARSRTMIAWKWWYSAYEAQLPAQSSLVLDALKYLSVSYYRRFRNMVGPVDLNIILLELTVEAWGTDTINSLSNLPSLRVLVLIQNLHELMTILDITQKAEDCFRRLPTLEYIIWRSQHPDGYRYIKLFLSTSPTEGILQEGLNIHYNLGAPWWMIYNI